MKTRHPFGGLRAVCALHLLVACLVSSARAQTQQQTEYDFVNIADTNGQFSDFSGNSFTVNSNGTVAFSATLKSGGRAVFVSNGNLPSKIAQTGEQLDGESIASISDTASISNSGAVAFHAVFNEFRQAIYTSFGGSTTKAAPLHYYDLKSPGVNSAGKVAWTGFFGLGGPGVNTSRFYVLRSPAPGESGQQGSAGAIMAHTGGQDNITGFFDGFGLANLNDRGLVVFRATIRSGGEGIYANDTPLPDRFTPGDSKTTLVADTVSPGSIFSGFGDIARNRPDVNNSNIVVFGATLKAGGHGIFRAFPGAPPLTVADNSGVFSQVALTPAINSSGVIAFAATVRKTGRAGIFVGPDPVADSVLQTGSALFGSSVVALAGGARTISDSGHVAFFYRLADGRSGIAVAKPKGNKKPTGDLVIKEAAQPPSAFAAPGIYVPAPAGNQLRIVTTEPKAGAEVLFDVELRNNSDKDERYILTGFEAGDSGWKIEALAGTADNWPGIKASGARTPVMAPGAKLALRMRMTSATGAALPRGSTREFVLAAIGETDPSFTHDAVGGRAEVVAINITMHRPTFGGLTSASIAGRIDDPLEFVADTNALDVQPRIDGGLVADGVTPLLFRLEAGALQELEYDVSLEVQSGGTLRGFPVAERIRVLKNGQWSTNRRISFSGGQQVNYLQIDPIIADDLQLTAGQTELTLLVRLRRASDGSAAESKSFLVRRPYITLIHGYNTGGDWGGAFVQALKQTRHGEFIRVVRYGQQPADAPDTARLATVLPFGDLAFILDNQLNAVRREMAQRWAFTRHDAVCHSQGGVLARMLLSRNDNRWVSDPFRNDANFRRGRFHRLVTIGSPHNGTRLVRYMTALKSTGLTLSHFVPQLASRLLISNGTVQPKFDPIGPEIARINDPSPGAPWSPDPEAKVHMVQTKAPIPGAVSLSELSLGLATDVVRVAVLPLGGDGVVDFESMAAIPRRSGPASNVFYLDATRYPTSHAYVSIPTGDLFGGDAGQVTSVAAADHIRGALDHTNSAIFGPFVVPPPIPQGDVDAIREAASRTQVGKVSSRRSSAAVAMGTASSAPDATLDGGTFEFEVDPSALSQPVTWIGSKFGAAGVELDGGFSLIPLPDQPGAVSVSVDSSRPGDVVLNATAYLQDGTTRMAPAVLAASVEPNPADYRLSSIEVLPSGGTYPTETAIVPELWANYQCISAACSGTVRIRRWIDPAEFRVSSSTPGIVNIVDPANWIFTGVGNASISAEWRGLRADATFRIYDPATGPAGRLLNISTRLQVGTGENALIGGFIITGTEPKKVIVRAIGPSLAALGISGVLMDPTLDLVNSAGESIAFNNDWRSTQESEIEASTIPPSNDAESAIVQTLDPGFYTAVVRGNGNGTGVGLVEVYDLSAASQSKLANISSRGFVNTGENVMIGGFIMSTGAAGATVGVRALGPSLGALGVAGALQDPALDLVDANGSVIASNNNWKEAQQAEIERFGIQPRNDLESTIIAQLQNGNYTAVVRGVNGGTGVGLVEVYQLE